MFHLITTYPSANKFSSRANNFEAGVTSSGVIYPHLQSQDLNGRQHDNINDTTKTINDKHKR